MSRLVTAAYLPPTLAFALALLGRHESTRPRARIIVTFIAFAVLMVLLPVVDATAGVSLAAVLTLAAFVGIFDGLGQPAIYGETALLPSAYTQAVVAGTAASGLATSLLRVITKAVTPAAGGGRLGVGVFFGSSALECAVAAALYGWALPRTTVWRGLAAGHLEGVWEGERGRWKGKRELSTKTNHPLQNHFTARASMNLAAAKPDTLELTPRRAPLEPILGRDAEAPTAPSSAVPSNAPLAGRPSRHPPPSRARVAARVWPSAAAMVIVYAVTISLFPGAFVDQVPRFGDWYFLCLVLLFNGADFFGKMVPAVPWVARTLPAPKTLLALALARTAFVPALIFSARIPSTTAAAAMVATVSTLLGVTNGYVTTGCFIKSSEGLYGRDAEDAGTVAVIALIAGLIAGSALSFLFLIGRHV